MDRNGTAANSDHGREPSDDEAIPWNQQDVCFKYKARFLRFSGLDLGVAVEQPYLGEHFRRTRVKVHRGPVLQSFGVRDEFQTGIGNSCRTKTIGLNEDCPAPDLLQIHTCQINRRPLPSSCLFRRCAMNLQSANAGLFAGRLNREGRLAFHHATGDGSCNRPFQNPTW